MTYAHQMPPDAKPDTVSKFVAASIERLSLSADARVLDLPCGFGRHARWIAARGYTVIGVDIAERRIRKARELSKNMREMVEWVVADIDRSLPLRDGSFDVAIVVHYVSDGIIETARRALRPGGHLILETFDARGENWRALPLIGSVPTDLERGFEIVTIHERSVGPQSARAVVRALARRRRT